MQITDFLALRQVVELLLRNGADKLSWSVQGFGMMRTYIPLRDDPKMLRLNIWDKRLAVPDVSVIHDHPWHLRSVVIAGELVNVRYDNITEPEDRSGFTNSGMVIKTGEGGGPEGVVGKYILAPRPEEYYLQGGDYSQEATEIHESRPVDGTATLNWRERVGDGEHARVFWPYGQEWVDAEPRPATSEEVSRTLHASLRRWF